MPARPILTPERKRRGRGPADSPLAFIAHWREALGKPLFVYFIQSGDNGPVKIGQAYEPIKRIAELQCGNPVTLYLRAVVLASRTLERELHYAWKQVAVRGEWFGEGTQEAIIELARNCQSYQIWEQAEGFSLYEISNDTPSQILNPRQVKPPSSWRITG